jgi:hypothetical protein
MKDMMMMMMMMIIQKQRNAALSVLAPEASAKRMNEWSSISVHSICLHGVYGEQVYYFI